MKQTFLFSPAELDNLVGRQERKPAKMVFSNEPDFGDIYDGYEDFNVCSRVWR